MRGTVKAIHHRDFSEFNKNIFKWDKDYLCGLKLITKLSAPPTHLTSNASC